MAKKIQAKRILQLREAGMSRTAISKLKGFGKHGVCQTFDAADEKGVTYASVTDMSDDEVYSLLFPEKYSQEAAYAIPDWEAVHKELAKTGVTMGLLHSEYADRCADEGAVSMGYDRFCKLYRQFTVKASVTSRVGHKAGRITEIDWSGPTMAVVNPDTGEVVTVYLFVGTLPFSRYSYVEATLDMKQDTWLMCHVHMFEYFGGSTPCLTCDNLKTGVVRHPKDGEVVLNDAYEQMAAHYGSAVMPGRVRKPKDKPSVENTVGNVATAVIAKLRGTVFTSLPALQLAVSECMEAYNSARFQKRPGSRLECFLEEEKPLLRPLPAVPWEVCEWVYGRKVQRNCHVSYKKNYYSVSHAYVGALVDLRVTKSAVEIYLGAERLATHVLFPAYASNRYATNDSHMPKGGTYRDWDAARIRKWSLRVGPSCAEVVNRIFQSVRFEEQGYNSCLSVLRLEGKYSRERLETACRLSLESGIRTPRWAQISPILETGQDIPGDNDGGNDENGGGYVRGADYYGGF